MRVQPLMGFINLLIHSHAKNQQRPELSMRSTLHIGSSTQREDEWKAFLLLLFLSRSRRNLPLQKIVDPLPRRTNATRTSSRKHQNIRNTETQM